jgi:hypothetical protein
LTLSSQSAFELSSELSSDAGADVKLPPAIAPIVSLVSNLSVSFATLGTAVWPLPEVRGMTVAAAAGHLRREPEGTASPTLRSRGVGGRLTVGGLESIGGGRGIASRVARPECRRFCLCRRRGPTLTVPEAQLRRPGGIGIPTGSRSHTLVSTSVSGFLNTEGRSAASLSTWRNTAPAALDLMLGCRQPAMHAWRAELKGIQLPDSMKRAVASV